MVLGRVILGCVLLVLTSCDDETRPLAPEFDTLEEGENLPGGGTTNTLLFGRNSYSRPAENITTEHDQMFFAGNGFFNQSWVEAPSSTVSHDGLGPLYNAQSCSGCHFKDGRGRLPTEADPAALGFLIRLSVPGVDDHGGTVGDPTYGGQFHPLAVTDIAPDGVIVITYEAVDGELEDGTPYSLRRPTLELAELAYGDADPDLLMSPRIAPAMIGLGLLESIPLERLEELADPDDRNDDGISGRINTVWNVALASTAAGRFGWKAEQPTVRQQAAGAFLGDIGITSEMFPTNSCTEAQTGCDEVTNGGDPEVDSKTLDRVVTYSHLLGVPMRISQANPTVLEGKGLFHEAGCANCHVPSHRTGVIDEFPELSSQDIWPYTDLLLHDLGEDLSDHRPSFEAEGAEWRTPPLWGLHDLEDVTGAIELLHDGRARSVEEAILWHGGEAEPAREAFRSMSKEERDALVKFVESL